MYRMLVGKYIYFQRSIPWVIACFSLVKFKCAVFYVSPYSVFYKKNRHYTTLTTSCVALCSAGQTCALRVRLVLLRQNNLIRVKDKGIEGMHSKQVSFEISICYCVSVLQMIARNNSWSKTSARESIDDVDLSSHRVPLGLSCFDANLWWLQLTTTEEVHSSVSGVDGTNEPALTILFLRPNIRTRREWNVCSAATSLIAQQLTTNWV